MNIPVVVYNLFLLLLDSLLLGIQVQTDKDQFGAPPPLMEKVLSNPFFCMQPFLWGKVFFFYLRQLF